MYITEEDVAQLLSVPECIDVLEKAFALPFINIPRYRLKSKNSLLHVMSASIPDWEVMGLKSYGTAKEGGQFIVLLFSEPKGTLLAVIEASRLGQIRTGAASGLATKLLARSDSRIGAIFGSGYQAETQLLAIDSALNLSRIKVFSRNAENRRDFVYRLKMQTRAELVNAESAEECAHDADVICTVTSSKEPVLYGKWLKPGCHINAAGSNWSTKRELDEVAVRKCDFVCVDHLEQSKLESGDLISVFRPEDWNSVVELRDVVQGKTGRSSPDQITLFKSNGIALEDIAAARFIYDKRQRQT